MNRRPNFPAKMTRRQVLTQFRLGLADAGIETAGLDARLLLAHALGISVNDLLVQDEAELGADGATVAETVFARRLNGESVARIVGAREFWGLPFRLSEATLEPRPDTETLVEAVLDSCPDRQAPLRILDLGTGTGCLLIALLTEFPSASGTGIDISQDALTTATGNAALNAVTERSSFIRSNWFEQVDGRFDLIVSNPPYIRSSVIPSLDPEVRNFDPQQALDGGEDGLDAYRIILSEAGRHLRTDGQVFLEIGFDQRSDLEILGDAAGFDKVTCRNDVAGHPRVIQLSEPGKSVYKAL